MDQLPSDYFITSLQFTKKLYKDVYPTIDPTNPELSAAGKVVIITGASRGIGAKGIAPAFAKAGAKAIVLVATNVERLRAIEKNVRDSNPSVQTLAVPTDISDEASVADLFAAVNEQFGHANILINNAGVNVGGASMHDEDPGQWWYNFEVNTKGAFLLAQQFLRALPTASTPATIVNLQSSGAWQVYPTMSGYCLSKLAALQLTTYIATAYRNVTAVGLHPGMLETDMLQDMFRGFDLNPPELIGGLSVWLSSERARFLSGKVIMANWDVEELMERKEEIAGGKVLQIDLIGKFGKEHFE